MTSPSFREHRLPDTSPCREFHPEVAVLPTTGDVTWAASESPDSIIFGSPNGKVMRLRTGGEPTVLRVVHPMGTPPPSPRGGLRDAQGRLWLGDTDGGLWLGTVDGDTITLERRVGPTAHGQVNTIDGDPNRPEDQLFVMTSSGTIAQLAGDRWVLLDQLPTPPHSDNNNTLVWMGRDELFAGSSAWPAVRVIRGPAREDIHFEETGPSAITGISRLGPREAAAGLSGGWVLRFVDEHWTSLGRSELTLDNHVFYRAGGAGFIYTGAFGYVAEWHPTAGFCPAPASPQAGATVHYVVPLGDALFLSGDEPRGNNPTAYTLLRIK